jgi:Ca2+/Na+ antiporter
MLPLLDLDLPWENIDQGDWAFFGIAIQVFVLLYSFMGLAIICDDHLVPALDTLCYVWGIPEDVAGATFMAFGSAAPEIVIAAVSTAQAALAAGDAEDMDAANDATSLGVSSVIGSGLIAFSLIPAVCGLVQAPGQVLDLKRRPLLRDELAYFFSLLALMYIIADGVVHTWEAATLVVIYIIYLLVIVFSHSIRVWFIMEVMD